MIVWHWAIFFVAGALPSMIRAQNVCALKPTNPAPVYTDKLVYWNAVSHLKGFTLERCVLECFLVKLCVSFNYRVELGVCTLNNALASETGYLLDSADSAGYLYHELQSWSDFQYMAGTCSDRPCAENQRCLQTVPYTCVDVDCGPNHRTHVTGAHPWKSLSTTSPTETSLGSVAEFSCNDDWKDDWFRINTEAPWYDPQRSICGSDFRWSEADTGCINRRNALWDTFHIRNSYHDNTYCYARLLCTSGRVQNCSAVRACNPSHGDGHYLLMHPRYSNSHKLLYCHDMAGTPRSYITLPPIENWSQTTGDGNTQPPTLTTFNKVRIDDDYNLVITDVFVDGIQTQGATMSASALGSAASCPTAGGSANFKIDLTGTGFKIGPGLPWADNLAFGHEIQSLDLTATTATGRCGGSMCGNCFPHLGLIPVVWLESPTKAADGSEAIVPTCVEPYPSG